MEVIRPDTRVLGSSEVTLVTSVSCKDCEKNVTKKLILVINKYGPQKS